MKYFFLLLVVLPIAAFAQPLPSIADKTKTMKKYDGFLPFYWDEDAGKIWLEISRTGQEILYLASLPAGLGSNDIGLDRGTMAETKIVQFLRVGRSILLVQPNYGYRAVSNDPNERRAVEQSFAQSTIWGFTAAAATGNAVLVDATDFLLRDAAKACSRIKAINQGTYTPDQSRSVMYLDRTKNFPQNTEFETMVTLVNVSDDAGNFVTSVAPSPEAITLRMHHSFVQLPDSNYTPLRFDPRSGFFNIAYYDYATPVSAPVVQYFACRHRLQKKDPAAPKSEPVKPIIYYLDNGTPEPIRTALLEGARWWNQAFEAAGYINAFQVKLLPDDADPMDVRYNMINWVHRSTRGWSYGDAVIDPRTGEIIKGNVTLGSLRVRQDYLIAQGLLAPFENGIPANDPMLKMALQRLSQLSAHEVGHTIGLMHNYSASTVNRSSVMDYPHPMATLDAAGNIDLSNAYDTAIGAWDKVSVAWGYGDYRLAADAQLTRNTILNNAFNSGLRFLTDQDARPAGAFSPEAHLWDNGSNPVDELYNVMKVRKKALGQFGANNIQKGMPMAMLEDVLVPVYFYHRYQLEAVTKLIGGLDYRYTLRGDGQPVTNRLPKGMEQKALDVVITCLEPQALMIPEKLVAQIPPRPAGYNTSSELFRKRTGLAFDALAPAETAADFTIAFLFNSERLNRMEQYSASGGLNVPEMTNKLIDATWKTPRKTGMAQLVQQQTEQVLLTYLLAASVDNNNSFQVKADIKQALSDLKKYMEDQQKTVKDSSYLAHVSLALSRMNNPSDARPTQHQPIPPGAPIGCDWE